MKNLNIGTRLNLGFGVVLLLVIALTLLGLRSMSLINDALVTVAEKNAAKMDAAADMREAQLTISVAVRDMALLKESSQVQAQQAIVTEAKRHIASSFVVLDKLVVFPKGMAILARIRSASAEAMPLLERAVQQAQAGQADAAAAQLAGPAAAPTARWAAALGELIDFQLELNAKGTAQAKTDYDVARLVLTSLGAAAVMAGMLIAWLSARSITVPMRRAVRIAETVAAGDLNSHIEVDSRDETGQLLQALKGMNANLHNIVHRVRSGTGTIATASSQIASGNMDLSSRTEQQASSLEETASSMEELTSTVKQNADNARQANTLAASASQVAVKGGKVVAEVVGTMASINASSKKIVDIIGVIDGIAFQTNILALNAAVEAARAGEQGRGFAVVAAEVRNLAQRAGSAAKEIKLLIDTSVDKVDTGTRLVAEAGTTMAEIVASVQRVTDIMGEITSASAEQESGIEQINIAISQMDTVTQQNAALVEQAAAAAASLQEQAADLEQVVSVFKVAAVHAAPAAPARRPAPKRLAVANGERWESY
ncbi:MAG: methyl-accepting chemotaxis protein [Pseudomonadota bacterium]